MDHLEYLGSPAYCIMSGGKFNEHNNILLLCVMCPWDIGIIPKEEGEKKGGTEGKIGMTSCECYQDAIVCMCVCMYVYSL